MRVEQEDMDYHVYLNDKEIEKLYDRTPSGVGLDIFPRYRPISAKFTDNMGEKKEMEIICTRDAFLLRNAKAHDGIYFGFDHFGPFIKVFAPKIASLLGGKEKYLTTRYDGESKIWIYRETNII